MKRVLLLAAVACAGCGGVRTEVETRTVATTRTCARISESPIVLCEFRTPRFRTRFFVTRNARLVPLAVESPSPIGHWVTAYLSPDRKTLLAQWSAECEVPVAYFVPARGGTPRPVAAAGTESVAQGWAPDGRAIVDFPKGACGSGLDRPGLYLVSLDGKRARVVTD